MSYLRDRKRAAHRRQIQSTLTRILNDPVVMPNADCEDLLVTVCGVEFGATVRDIRFWVAVRERMPSTNPLDSLLDALRLPECLHIIRSELQRRLALPYKPRLRHVS